jgi:hypothetical protein
MKELLAPGTFQMTIGEIQIRVCEALADEQSLDLLFGFSPGLGEYAVYGHDISVFDDFL